MRYSSKTILRHIAVLLLLFLAGCGGKAPDLTPIIVESSSDFELVIVNESYAFDGHAAGFKLTQSDNGDTVELRIAVEGARNLKALMCELLYDPLLYDPQPVECTGALDPAGGEVISQTLALDTDPGYICYGQILPQPHEREGFSGDAVLAIARFSESPDNALKAISAAPLNRRSQTPLSWSTGSNQLSWHYYSSGDFNQDGYVGVADLTPIGIHWKEHSGGGPFPDSDSASVVDYDNNGEINGADMSALSRYYGTATWAYHVYTSLNSADYPTSPSATNGPGAVQLGNVVFNDWGSIPDMARHYFDFSVPEPETNAYYWIRPVHGEAEGIPSTLAGGPE